MKNMKLANSGNKERKMAHDGAVLIIFRWQILHSFAKTSRIGRMAQLNSTDLHFSWASTAIKKPKNTIVSTKKYIATVLQAIFRQVSSKSIYLLSVVIV